MDRMLGEVAAVTEIQGKDLVWIDGEYKAVAKVESFHNGIVRVTLLDGVEKFFNAGDNVIRGHYYLGVARRVG